MPGVNGEDDATRPGSDGAAAEAASAQRSSEPAGRRRGSPVEVDPRYDLGPVLGRGGMGEVRAAHDTRIDREVAIKLMHEAGRDQPAVARFLREAQLQGGLEHPAVVPVHDLGVDPAGRPYFVMKRLAGTTLADALATADARWPRRVLLARLVDVCLALELAHTRGIVHRDLKPANLMLGDFGEVYVLDWGLARMVGALDDTPGEVTGTPGYLAPEQALGEPAGTAADVFSLGLVLYEIVAGAPALSRGLAAVAGTLDAACHRPSDRAEVAPELDDLCARATDRDPVVRPTARGLADAIQAYLDGDRDLARRREVAAEHAVRAREAFEAATAVDGDDDARATAMREAGRALVLDPTCAAAADLLGRLVLETPARLPAGALASADLERRRIRQDVLRMAARGHLLLVCALVAFLLVPLRDRGMVVGMAAIALLSALVMQYGARHSLPIRHPLFIVLIGCTTTLLTAVGVLLGPLLVMPIFLIGSLCGYLGQPSGYRPWWTLVVHAVPIALVTAIELSGLLPPTTQIVAGSLVLSTRVVELTPLAVAAIYALAGVTQAANSYMLMAGTVRAQCEAQDLLHAQRWHLDQLVPPRAAPPR